MTPEIEALFQRVPEPLLTPPDDPEILTLAAAAVESVPNHPRAQAGLWLYVGDWERAHEACQLDESVTADWHAVIHRREGDFSNALYWHRRAGTDDVLTRRLASGHVSDAEAEQQQEWRDLWALFSPI
jgi:hypothetical protein